MRERADFSNVLEKFVKRDRRRARRLESASAELFGEHDKVSHATISRWLRGEVTRPRLWHDLVKLAIVMTLSESEASELLASASHHSIAELREKASDESTRGLLSYWDASEPSQSALSPLSPVAVMSPVLPARIGPFGAPPDHVDFTGREEEIKELKERLLNNPYRKVLCLTGMGGVGKTTLAIHLSYLLRPHFPDGILWAQLERSNTMSILQAFAESYGVDVSQQTDLASRSTQVRQILADKQALIVLDSAERDSDIRPLLPPTGPCMVIITTRHHDLGVADNAYRCHIKPFNREKKEGLALFAQILGSLETLNQETELTEIADLLGHLPLAISIAANRIKHEPGWTAASFLRRLESQRGLRELARGDQAVRLSFDLSYNTLAPQLQDFFATLGVFDGEDFGIEAVAYVAQLPIFDVEDYLRQLYNLSLVQQGGPGRYKLHPLLRDYSREQLAHLSCPAGAPPYHALRVPPLTDSLEGRMVTFFVDYIEAHQRDYTILDAENSNLFAALRLAFERHLNASLVRGATGLYPFLQARGLYDDAKSTFERAQQVSRESNDPEGLTSAMYHLGHLANKRGDYAEAATLYQEALTLARQTENREQLSTLLRSLGALTQRRGNLAQAKLYYEEGIILARQAANKPQIAAFFTNLGLIEAERGHYEKAESYYTEALQLARQVGHRKRLICILLQNLGVLPQYCPVWLQYEPSPLN